MNDIDDVVDRIARLRRREDVLADDIVIATYKGHGVTGGTRDEIEAELTDVTAEIERLQSVLDEGRWDEY